MSWFGAGCTRSVVSVRVHDLVKAKPRSTRRFVQLMQCAALLLITAMSLPSCYLLKQGTSLIGFQLQAQPVDRIMSEGAYRNGDSLPDGVRAFLEQVKRIRSFATDELGLSASSNYTTFVPTDREHLAYVVSAVRELSFERNYWRWPIAGSFPYKGFYDVDDAVRLAREMRKRGYDVWVRPVDAFSTLGILSDPLFEFMVGYDTYDLANTIIHEQTHATIFIKDQVQFNEELATFIGDVGALQFLEYIGTAPDVFTEIEHRIADRATFRGLIFELRDRLDAMYESDISDDQKRKEKERLIGEHRSDIATRYAELFLTVNYQNYSEMEINNAYIDLFVKYTEDLSLFAELYEVNDRSVRSLITDLAVLLHPENIEDRDARAMARSDPKAYIRTYLLNTHTVVESGSIAVDSGSIAVDSGSTAKVE